MGQIPLDGLLEASSKGRFREPAQFVVDLRRVDGVAAVVAFAVRHVRNEAFRLMKLLANELYNVDIAHFVVTADVVDFPSSPLPDDEVDSLAMVFYVEPIAHVQTIAIDGQGLIVEGVDDHEGNELFREMVRPIVVGAAGNSNGQAVRPVIGQNEEVCAGFGAAVRARRMERRRFRKEEVRPKGRSP